MKSKWENDSLSIRYLFPNFAAIHIYWKLTCDHPENDSIQEVKEGLFTWIVQKVDGHWLIIQAININIKVYQQLVLNLKF